MAELRDPWNPTWTEVREWAYEHDADEPCQDWDLSLLWRGYEDLYLELAADDRCPKSQFFLSLLYLIVGDHIRKGTDHETLFSLRAFLAKADAFNSKALQKWKDRSNELLRHPDKFNYQQWCAGGLASEQ
ncbi:MAG: hypothetical protein WAU86_24020 [Oricola sp.]